MSLLISTIQREFWWRFSKRYFCPVCHAYYPFLPFRSPLRNRPFPGVECPLCGSVWRTRILYLICQTLWLNRQDNVTVVHTAPERPLWQTFSQKKNWNYIPIDLFPEKFPPEYQCVKADLTQLPFEDQTTDFFISSQVLEHVPDEKTALKEIFRILKPTGKALLCLPVSDMPKTLEEADIIRQKSLDRELTNEERLQFFGQSDHVRLFGQDVLSLFYETGFKVNQIQPERIYPQSFLDTLGNPGLTFQNNRLHLDGNQFYLLEK